MRRRKAIKSLLTGAVLVSGCSSQPDPETTTPAETATSSYPEAGELSVRESETDERYPDPLWDLVLKLDEGIDAGTLKVIEKDERPGYNDEVIDRVNLEREGAVFRFPYITDHGHEVRIQLPRDEYLFRVEDDDEVVAQSRIRLERKISADEVRFESHIGGEEYEYEPQVLDPGKTSFSVLVENTGNVPLVIETVAARDLNHYVLTGFWLGGELRYEGHDYLIDILPPGESERYGAVGYALPRLEQVEEVCDGSPRSTVLEIESAARSGSDSWRYELSYSLDEPATGTGLPALNHDQEKFACESGEIYEFTEIGSD